MTEISASQWYIGKASGEREGPFTTDEMVRMRLKRRVDDATPCWREGMGDWLRLDQAPLLTTLINFRRRRFRSRLWTIAALVIVCAVAGGVLLKKLVVPKAITSAERLLAEGDYLAAGQTLRPYLEKNGYKDPRALTLMGAAALAHYATSKPTDRSRHSGFFQVPTRQEAESVDFARKLFQRAFAQDESWRGRAAQYAGGVVSEIPEDAQDVCDRCAQTATLLAELKIGDPAELAQQVLAKYRNAAGGISQAGSSQQFAEVVLLGNPSLDGQLISAVYRFRRETPVGQRLGAPGNMFVSWAEQNPKLSTSLCTGLSEHAKTASASHNYGECDDALGALCRIDGAAAPLANAIWQASLTSHLESSAVGDADSARQVVRRINDLAGKPGADLQAVTNLYLVHRAKLISSDPRIELGLSYRLQQAIATLGDKHFLSSGDQLLQEGKYEAAVAELRRIRNGSQHYASAAALLHKAEFQLYRQTGEKALEDRNYPAAEQAFRQALALEPNDQAAASGLAKCARAAEQDAIEISIARAKAASNNGRFEEARSVLARLLEEHPDDPNVTAELRSVNQKLVRTRLQEVHSLVTQGNLEGAEAGLQAILADLPDNSEAKQLLDQVQSKLAAADLAQATSLVSEKRFVQAQAVIERALKRRPTDTKLVALRDQVKQFMDDPETTDLSGTWAVPDGTRLVLSQHADQVVIRAENMPQNFTSWEGRWTRDGKTLDGSFQITIRGDAKPKSIDVRAEIQGAKTIRVAWKDVTWLNTQKTRGRGHGVIDWVRAAAEANAGERRRPGFIPGLEYGYGSDYGPGDGLGYGQPQSPSPESRRMRRPGRGEE